MNFKIQRLESGNDSAVFSVSGWIQAEHIETLRELAAQENSSVALDLHFLKGGYAMNIVGDRRAHDAAELWEDPFETESDASGEPAKRSSLSSSIARVNVPAASCR